MSNIDVAKDLLRKGILLGDPDLIAIANKLLGEPQVESVIITDTSVKAPPKRGRPKKNQKEVDKPENFGTIANKRSDREVRWEGNTWRDTGETGDIDKKDLKTPKIKPTQRRPKYSKVKHKCSKCDKDVNIYPHDKTEYYKCDKCLREITGIK